LKEGDANGAFMVKFFEDVPYDFTSYIFSKIGKAIPEDLIETLNITAEEKARLFADDAPKKGKKKTGKNYVEEAEKTLTNLSCYDDLADKNDEN